MSEPLARILCVDDEPSVRDMMVTYLTREGYDVAGAALPEHAIDYLNSLDWNQKEAPVDLVLTDAHDNYRMLNTVQNAYPWIPVILVSGTWDVPDEAEESIAGMLRKPFNIDELGDIVERILATRPKSVRIDASELIPYQKNE